MFRRCPPRRRRASRRSIRRPGMHSLRRRMQRHCQACRSRTAAPRVARLAGAVANLRRCGSAPINGIGGCMARRALVLGSQIEGLRGVDNDCHRIAELLDASEFTVDLRTGEAAAREGVLAGYDRLIAASAAEDAAVVYYCGHGY
ncbi:MAG: caspase family protein, partial [bacterium]